MGNKIKYKKINKMKQNLENLIKFQGDAKKTWCIMRELIGKVKINKSSLPFKIVPDIAFTLFTDSFFTIMSLQIQP